MVEAAEEPRPVMTSQVPLNRREILAERELFLELARDLRSPDPSARAGLRSSSVSDRQLLALLRNQPCGGASPGPAPSPGGAPPRLNRMDLLSIAIALAAFGLLLLLIEGLDRV